MTVPRGSSGLSDWKEKVINELQAYKGREEKLAMQFRLKVKSEPRFKGLHRPRASMVHRAKLHQEAAEVFQAAIKRMREYDK